MTLDAERIGQPVEDAVSSVLKWVLLAVAIVNVVFAAGAVLIAWDFFVKLRVLVRPRAGSAA